MKMKVGFIGLGLMGMPMAKHILDSGFKLYVWNRSPEKALDLQQQGAIISLSPQDLATNVDIIMLCVTDEKAIETVLFGKNGIVAANKKDQIIVDHSTILPASAKKIAFELKKYDLNYIDAPVTGSVPGAINGTLVVFTGGNSDALDKAKPIILSYSKRINYMGENGLGQATKICNQTMLINTILLVFETLNLARGQGLDAQKLLTAFEDSLVDSKACRIFASHALSANPQKLAHIKDVLKDLEYVDAVAQSTNSSIFLTETTLNLVKLFVQKGYGQKDVTELLKLYQQRTPKA